MPRRQQQPFVESDARPPAAMPVLRDTGPLSHRAVHDFAREVISRMAHSPRVRAREVPGLDPLFGALIGGDTAAARRHVRELLATGMPLREVYFDYLGGVMRRLGEGWVTDAVPSTAVTLAAGRVLSILHGLPPQASPAPEDARHAVFATVPGERHLLGVTMAADLLRRDGWLIELKVGRSQAELMAELASSEARLLGLSLGCAAGIGAAERLIAALRAMRPGTRIVLCGGLVEQRPDLSLRCGADAGAADFETARAALERLAGTPETVPARSH